MDTEPLWNEDDDHTVDPVVRPGVGVPLLVCAECGSESAAGVHEDSCPYLLAELVRQYDGCAGEPLPFLE